MTVAILFRLIVAFELSAAFCVSYHTAMTVLGTDEDGCSGVFVRLFIPHTVLILLIASDKYYHGVFSYSSMNS